MLNDYCLEKYVKVSDDWFPNYPQSTIKVSLKILNYNGYYVKFNAWGCDDFGMEIEYSGTFEECVSKWNEFKILYDSIPATTNKNWFRENGFQNF